MKTEKRPSSAPVLAGSRLFLFRSMLPPKVELKSDRVDLNSGPFTVTVTFDDKRYQAQGNTSCCWRCWLQQGMDWAIGPRQSNNSKGSCRLWAWIDSGAIETWITSFWRIANGYGGPKSATSQNGKRIKSVGDSVGHDIGIWLSSSVY